MISRDDGGSRAVPACAGSVDERRDHVLGLQRVDPFQLFSAYATRRAGDESWGLYTLVEDPADPAMLTS